MAHCNQINREVVDGRVREEVMMMRGGEEKRDSEERGMGKDCNERKWGIVVMGEVRGSIVGRGSLSFSCPRLWSQTKILLEALNEIKESAKKREK